MVKVCLMQCIQQRMDHITIHQLGLNVPRTRALVS
jgi:hypothetical protein